MLLKLLKDARPSHIAVVFDSREKRLPRRSVRILQGQPGRDAQRSDRADPLSSIAWSMRFASSSLVIDGYEADDVIGTLALRAAREHFNVVIVTGDKDFMQLVSPNITLWDTMFGKRTGLREVRERFGVEPPALVDIMALMGDAIDNVKGVPGVGEKTATALIAEFRHRSKAARRNLDRLGQSDNRGARKNLAALLAEHRDDAELASNLVKIATEVPLEFEPAELAGRGIDREGGGRAAARARIRLAFGRNRPRPKSSCRRLPSAEIPVATANLAAALADAARRSASRLPSWRGCRRSASCSSSRPRTTRGFTFGRIDLIGATAELLVPPAPPVKACHDLKRHLGLSATLRRHADGGRLRHDDCRFSGQSGQARSLRSTIYITSISRRWADTPAAAPSRVVSRPCAHALRRKLEENELDRLYRRYRTAGGARAGGDGSRSASASTPTALRSMSAEFSEQLSRLERECYELAGREFNLNSPIQLREVLFNDLKLPTKGLKKTKSGLLDRRRRARQARRDTSAAAQAARISGTVASSSRLMRRAAGR